MRLKYNAVHGLLSLLRDIAEGYANAVPVDNLHGAQPHGSSAAAAFWAASAAAAF